MTTEPPPRPRRHRAGHGSVYDIRRASGLRLAERVSLQTRRDDLVHDLARIDAQLLALSQERQQVMAELHDLREALYPPIPWSHGRRPPDLDAAPLPPAPPDAVALVGRPLRAACRQILRRHGATRDRKSVV